MSLTKQAYQKRSQVFRTGAHFYDVPGHNLRNDLNSYEWLLVVRTLILGESFCQWLSIRSREPLTNIPLRRSIRFTMAREEQCSDRLKELRSPPRCVQDL